jgi:hypothetical protein
MPFLDDAQPAGFAPQLAEPAQITPPVPPFGKLFEAAMGQQNPYVSAVEAFTQPRFAPYDPSFDPFAHIQGYEDYASAFIGANSEDDVLSVKTRIDAERKRSTLLDAGGWRGTLANIGAGMADPVMLIPVGGELVAVSRTGRALQGALHTGVAAGGIAAAQEAALQSTQLTRPFSQSLETIAAATVLGGILGAGAGAITRDTAASAARAGEVYERELTSNLSPGAVPEGTVGAASARTTLDQETLANTLGVDRALAFSSPTLRLATSPAVETRQAAQMLADQPLVTRGNIEGIASPISVERRINLAQGPMAEALTAVDDAFVRYRLDRARRFGDIALIGIKDAAEALRTRAAMTYGEFAEAVGRAMRRGDVSDIPEVAVAARAMRDKLFDPLGNRAIEAGLLPDEIAVETATSYLSRIYNTTKISAQRPAFERILADWLPTTKSPELAGMDDLELRDIARQITDTLLGAAPGRTHYGPVPLKRGPLKERTLSIPDELIEDFLESDVRVIARAYTRTMAADTELTNSFGNAGMEDALERVREGYARLREGVTDERRNKALDRRMAADLRDLEAVRDRVRGTFALPTNPDGLWNRAYHLIRDLNYLRLLGGMTISAFPDLGRTVMTHGIMSVIGDGIVPLVTEFSRFRLAANEVKLAGNALDMVLDTRAMAMADMMDDYGRWSRYERGLKALTDQFGMVTLMAPWNAALKQFVGVISQTRALRAIEAMAEDERWYHGGREVFDAAKAREVYLTTDAAQAGHYAEGAHLGGYGTGEPRVSQIVPKPGRVVNVDDALFEAMDAGDDLGDALAGAIADARSSGARYVEYSHPNAGTEGEHTVRVSLYPQEDLQVGEAPRGRVSVADRTRLAHLGIGPDEARKIAREFRIHGDRSTNLWWANTADWNDVEAADVFRAAMSKEVDIAIVTPGQEKPLWMSTGIGRVVGQFRSFAFASAQRVLMTGLQQRDMASLNGALLMVALGMGANWVRNQIDSQAKPLADPTTPEGAATWIKEGLDRSGLTGWLFDAHNILEKVTRGTVGVSSLTGGPPLSRYASRNVLESVLGPTVGMGEAAVQAVGAATSAAIGDGEWTDADRKAVRRMLPYQNLWATRWLFDQAEQGLAH